MNYNPPKELFYSCIKCGITNSLFTHFKNSVHYIKCSNCKKENKIELLKGEIKNLKN